MICAFHTVNRLMQPLRRCEPMFKQIMRLYTYYDKHELAFTIIIWCVGSRRTLPTLARHRSNQLSSLSSSLLLSDATSTGFALWDAATLKTGLRKNWYYATRVNYSVTEVKGEKQIRGLMQHHLDLAAGFRCITVMPLHYGHNGRTKKKRRSTSSLKLIYTKKKRKIIRIAK